MSDTNPTRAVLVAARALIDTEEKWCQGGAEGDNGSICAQEALYRASPQLFPEVLALVRTEINGASIADWQDEPDRTHAEVLALLDRAIAAQEGGGA